MSRTSGLLDIVKNIWPASLLKQPAVEVCLFQSLPDIPSTHLLIDTYTGMTWEGNGSHHQ